MTTDFEADGERARDDGGETHGDVPPMGQVPLAALQAERGRRQAAERERDELLARLPAEPEAVLADDGHAQSLVAEEPLEHGDLSSLNEHLNASEAVARENYGDAAVDAAEVWAEQAMRRDPTLAAEILSHPDPYAFALGYAFSAGAVMGNAPRAAHMAPRSLANAPSAGGAAHVAAGPGQAYDSLFSRG